jgi:hypothetical protein
VLDLREPELQVLQLLVRDEAEVAHHPLRRVGRALADPPASRASRPDLANQLGGYVALDAGAVGQARRRAPRSGRR